MSFHLGTADTKERYITFWRYKHATLLVDTLVCWKALVELIVKN